MTLADDNTRKIVGYDENGKALWVQYVNQDYWFLKPFDQILKVHFGLELNDENVKQVQDLYQGDIDRLWDLHDLCRGFDDHNHAINSHLLHPDLPIPLLRNFMAKFPKIPGSAFKSLLSKYASHRCLDKVEYVVKDTAEFTTIIEGKVQEHKVKILEAVDHEKVANWIVGQVMKEIKDKSKVNIPELKIAIKECIEKVVNVSIQRVE